MASGRKLVIVESPAKARTIAGYLGPDWDVEASVGHIRDIPTPSEMPAEIKKGPFGRFGVNIDDDFDPYYVVDADKKKKVRELKALLKDADELYLATDEDREGEAIAWHLYETLQPKIPVKRMVFHEITREAIQRAANQTRDINAALVDAQETRRILDRLYGYEVSPVLWRKVAPELSAGRVQSVATRMVVERERERMAFVAGLVLGRRGRRHAGRRRRPLHRPAHRRRRQAGGHRPRLRRRRHPQGRPARSSSTSSAPPASPRRCGGVRVTVAEVSEKPYTRRPSAPFTTSTLQQEASRKLRLNSRNAMRVAQRLYENGYITYMRTDSTALSDTAISAARQQARDMYGAASVPDAPAPVREEGQERPGGARGDPPGG